MIQGCSGYRADTLTACIVSTAHIKGKTCASMQAIIAACQRLAPGWSCAQTASPATSAAARPAAHARLSVTQHGWLSSEAALRPQMAGCLAGSLLQILQMLISLGMPVRSGAVPVREVPVTQALLHARLTHHTCKIKSAEDAEQER